MRSQGHPTHFCAFAAFNPKAVIFSFIYLSLICLAASDMFSVLSYWRSWVQTSDVTYNVLSRDLFLMSRSRRERSWSRSRDKWSWSLSCPFMVSSCLGLEISVSWKKTSVLAFVSTQLQSLNAYARLIAYCYVTTPIMASFRT